MDSLTQLIVIFMMTMFISATISQATTVVIHNNLEGGLSLGYHCKSGDDDLGYKSLAPGGSGSFDFNPDIFGRTQKRDREFEKFGCTQCEWRISKKGPCKLNKYNKMFDVCYPWDA
ncbi:hypothetical protein HID58_043894 [Brassica napus]|uniref:S-protein homolog n=1 Tax=Brassica napus TaxID=3708 RepID=A0ABQ8BHV0_BRANA|nr:hypothetical protein HID58_043894 [Brassica napus]